MLGGGLYMYIVILPIFINKNLHILDKEYIDVFYNTKSSLLMKSED